MSVDPNSNIYNVNNTNNNPEQNEFIEKIYKASDTKTILKHIKDYLYGEKISDRTEEIETILDKISHKILSKDPQNYTDMFLRTFSGLISNEDISPYVYNLLSDREVINRIRRYINYDEIVEYIPFCGKALKVLTGSIVSPDDVYKKTFTVECKNPVSSITNKEQLNLIHSIVDNLGIEKKLRLIVQETLKYGDFFVEIANIMSKDVSLSQILSRESDEEIKFEPLLEQGNFIDESYYVQNDNTNIITEHIKFNDDVIFNIRKTMEVYLSEDEVENIVDNLSNGINISIELVKEEELNPIDEIIDKIDKQLNNCDINDIQEILNEIDIATIKKPKIDDFAFKRETNIQDIVLLLHEPYRVIKLQSRRYKTCIGYLVFPDIDIDINKINYISNTYPAMPAIYAAGSILSNRLMGSNEIIRSIDNIYKNLVNKLKIYLQKDDIYFEKEEIKSIIEKFIGEVSKDNKPIDIKVRYVPVDRMIHFNIPSTKFFPYGESIFTNVYFKCKLFIALQTASVVKGVSDAVDKRIVYVDTGLKRDARDIMETIKEALRKRKFMLGENNTIGAVPSMVTSSELIMIPTIHGRRVLEFDTLPAQTRTEEMANDLTFLRNSILSGLDVPPAYLNIEENISNRTTLAFENILFAQTISYYQDIFSEQLRELLNKLVFVLTNKNISKDIVISFTPPRLLQMERDAEKYEIANRVISVLVDWGVPKEYLIEKYLDMPKEELENIKSIQEIKDKYKKTSENNNPEQFNIGL